MKHLKNLSIDSPKQAKLMTRDEPDKAGVPDKDDMGMKTLS